MQVKPNETKKGRETPPRATVKKNKTRCVIPASAKSPARPPKEKYVLRLFVAGATTRSRQAILRVRELCETELKGGCDLEVIDIYQQPALARANQIVATPTLIIEFPPPLRRFIGNLTNITGLFVELDLVKKVKLTV
jgi:circadian clock protein KaiB